MLFAKSSLVSRLGNDQVGQFDGVVAVSAGLVLLHLIGFLVDQLVLCRLPHQVLSRDQPQLAVFQQLLLDWIKALE